MQRCSDTIGALAGALAKAQTELTNPAKSLIATIGGLNPREVARTFRYAPLSAGLEIVRKCLGQHEIATVQTTAIDPKSGLIQLTTLLAHSSGEWMSSEWPVCPLTDAGAPHRMGAALTYARRYALFSLVGIAGEDDLDAPDLPSTQLTGGAADKAFNTPDQRQGSGYNGRQNRALRIRPTLAADDSAVAREQLMAELAGLVSPDQIHDWAKRSLPVKNSLSNADAALIEQAFQAKLADLPASNASLSEAHSTAPPNPPRESAVDFESQVTVINPKPRRLRDRHHLRFVCAQPCLVCGRQPADAHHLRFAQAKALGRKVSDEFTVPLCRVHHREIHRTTKEAEWWSRLGIDPLQIAHKLWTKNHPIPGENHREPDLPSGEARQRAIAGPLGASAAQSNGV